MCIRSLGYLLARNRKTVIPRVYIRLLSSPAARADATVIEVNDGCVYKRVTVIIIIIRGGEGMKHYYVYI